VRVVVFALLIGCGSSKPPPEKPVECEEPAAGQPMTEEMCTCRKGNVQLSIGRAVELHCEPGEVELGAVRLGDRDGWCCRQR
jgi:hypothetical protein